MFIHSLVHKKYFLVFLLNKIYLKYIKPPKLKLILISGVLYINFVIFVNFYKICKDSRLCFKLVTLLE